MINKVVVIGSIVSMQEDVAHVKTWEFTKAKSGLEMTETVVRLKFVDSYTPVINELIIFKGWLTEDLPTGYLEKKEMFYNKN